MTWCNSRRYFYRLPHLLCYSRTTFWDNFIYYFRSYILFWFLLSLFPFQLSPNPRNWLYMTPHWYYPIKPFCRPTPKHCCPPGLWCIRNMSTPQTPQWKSQTSDYCPSNHLLLGNLFYCFTSHRILWSPIYYCWFCIRINFFCHHRISRPACYYWNYFPPCQPVTHHRPSFFSTRSFWFWSRSMILTLCRRSLNFALPINLLMRLLDNPSQKTKNTINFRSKI